MFPVNWLHSALLFLAGLSSVGTILKHIHFIVDLREVVINNFLPSEEKT